jgi:CubicO group peptidase (beta-lactamase class C family)
LHRKILKAIPSPDNLLNIHSLLIARHGKLVLEEYFYGYEADRTHDMRSASKAIAPVLVGIARDRGVRIGPETPAFSLFPKYEPFANWDQRKSRMTVEDLMNMASGLSIDDADSLSPGEENRMQGQTEQPDWYKYTLDLPMARDPGGEHPIYGSANINLVGGAVRNATGRWLPELFDEYYFLKCGFSITPRRFPNGSFTAPSLIPPPTSSTGLYNLAPSFSNRLSDCPASDTPQYASTPPMVFDRL